MWIYEQSSGEMYRISPITGQALAAPTVGYSGAPGLTKNNPAYQDVHNEGPIPQGQWLIASLTVGQTPHGPYVLRLLAEDGTNTFGRDGFLIHGDSFKSPGSASEGCIIMPRPFREQIWLSGDRELKVIA